jgi:PAS domain S-box-containing protein
MNIAIDEARQGCRGGDPPRHDDGPAHLASLQEIYDAIPAALCIIDRDLRFVSLNRRMAELTGHPAEYYIGRAIGELVPDARQLEQPLRLALAGERIYDCEAGDALFGSRHDGRGLHVSLAPLHHDGSVAGVVCAVNERWIGAGSEPAIEPNGREQEQGRILVAEDLPMNQVIVADMLESAGYAVVSVDNGATAVTLLRREPFDLVLMDIEMPLMGGIEAAGAIRNLERAGGIPIVAMTANNWTEQVAACRDAGMDAYLSKPVDRSDLLAVVRRLLKQKPSLAAEYPGQRHPGVDVHALDSLESRFGKDKMRSFVDIVREQINLAFAILPDCSDRDQLGNVLHALVSLAGHIGLRDVSVRSRALMAAVRNGSDDVKELANEFRASVDQALSELDARYSDVSHVTW